MFICLKFIFNKKCFICFVFSETSDDEDTDVTFHDQNDRNDQDRNQDAIVNLPTDVENVDYSGDDMSVSSDNDDEHFSLDEECSSDENDEVIEERRNISMDINDPPLYVIPSQAHLYKSSITKSEHLLAASALTTRHNLSQTALSDILDFIQIHIPDENIAETSVSKLKDECGFGPNQLQYHLYCDGCKKMFNDNDICQTPNCTGSKQNLELKKYFVTSKLEEQLQDILERPRLWDLVEQSNACSFENDVISDIKSGTGYLKLKQPGGFLHKSTNITLTLFTDGIPLFSSSSVSLWPVYLLINELPPHEDKYVALGDLARSRKAKNVYVSTTTSAGSYSFIQRWIHIYSKWPFNQLKSHVNSGNNGSPGTVICLKYDAA